LNVSPFNGVRATAAKQVGLNPDGKELRVESAFICAHGIEMPVAETRLQINVLIDQTLGGVGVHINYKCAPVNGKRIVSRRWCFRSRHWFRWIFSLLGRVTIVREQEEQANEQYDNHSLIRPPSQKLALVGPSHLNAIAKSNPTNRPNHKQATAVRTINFCQKTAS
jgi:hypothetical protein